MESSSASGSLKKARRRPGSGKQVPSCLVDGCFSDLGKCKDYHQRHKVCELHSKSSKVFVKGQERRFCQQCSRFHSLGEFDEGKRSCRKRLEGHNRRRRKPQLDSLSITSSSLFSNHQGTTYIHFGDPQASSASTTTASLAEVVKVEDDSAIYNCQSSLNFNSGKNPFPGSSSHKGGKQFPFLQGTESIMFPGEPIGQATLNAATILVDSGRQKMFCVDGFNRVIDCNRALSLLSSPPAEMRRDANLYDVVHPDPTAPAQSLISNLSYNSSVGVGVTAGSLMVSHRRSNDDIHKQNMFHLLPDESSAREVRQKMSLWE